MSIETAWRPMDGKGQQPHTITGNIQALYRHYSPQLDDYRDLFVYLPPSYDSGTKKYPVVYMLDGQNLFDQATSYAGEWYVDEIMEQLSGSGIEAIIAGISNGREKRMIEYNPYCSTGTVNRGILHLNYVIDTVKPCIDATFRTRPQRDTTGMIGSSMGGLTSLYAFLHYPDTFGFIGALSHWMWVCGQVTPEIVCNTLDKLSYVKGKIYIDIGRNEYVDSSLCGMAITPDQIVQDSRRLAELIIRKGYSPGKDLLFCEVPGSGHSETEWTARLPGILRFLLSGL